MYICVCNAVTEKEIRQAVELGAESFRQISNDLGVGTCCGKCKKDACRIIHEHKVEMREMNAALTAS